jgi:large conductance mechanosensitive channel
MALTTEFKEFISRGNVIDLAVGVVIGGAFGKIVDSLVNDLLMPPIGLLIGGVDFKDLQFILKPATVDALGKVVDPVAIHYGVFIQAAINFLIIALAIFLLVVKPINAMRKRAEARAQTTPAAPVPPTKQEVLLTEIRDLLRSRN